MFHLWLSCSNYVFVKCMTLVDKWLWILELKWNKENFESHLRGSWIKSGSRRVWVTVAEDRGTISVKIDFIFICKNKHDLLVFISNNFLLVSLFNLFSLPKLEFLSFFCILYSSLNWWLVLLCSWMLSELIVSFELYLLNNL